MRQVCRQVGRKVEDNREEGERRWVGLEREREWETVVVAEI